MNMKREPFLCTPSGMFWKGLKKMSHLKRKEAGKRGSKTAATDKRETHKKSQDFSEGQTWFQQWVANDGEERGVW